MNKLKILLLTVFLSCFTAIISFANTTYEDLNLLNIGSNARYYYFYESDFGGELDTSVYCTIDYVDNYQLLLTFHEIQSDGTYFESLNIPMTFINIGTSYIYSNENTGAYLVFSAIPEMNIISIKGTGTGVGIYEYNNF